MAYVKKTLAPGEEYLYRAHFNWTYDFQSWGWLLLGAVPALFWILSLSLADGQAMGRTFWLFAGAALAAGTVICLTRYVHKWTTVIAVTSVRMVLKTGMIARAAHEVMLDEIEEVLVRQSFLGRILGYGVIKVRGTGEAIVEFPVIGKPMRVRQEIETAVMRARDAAKQK